MTDCSLGSTKNESPASGFGEFGSAPWGSAGSAGPALVAAPHGRNRSGTFSGSGRWAWAAGAAATHSKAALRKGTRRRTADRMGQRRPVFKPYRLTLLFLLQRFSGETAL